MAVVLLARALGAVRLPEVIDAFPDGGVSSSYCAQECVDTWTVPAFPTALGTRTTHTGCVLRTIIRRSVAAGSLYAPRLHADFQRQAGERHGFPGP